jgi:hypothetical protein
MQKKIRKRRRVDCIFIKITLYLIIKVSLICNFLYGSNEINRSFTTYRTIAYHYECTRIKLIMSYFNKFNLYTLSV